jgi:hypothetical protein
VPASDVRHWHGLLLMSDASASTLLAHLRRMLTVSFGLHHRTLLSFYNPQTASYFFDACDARELSRWLGPISQLRWFGGTWPTVRSAVWVGNNCSIPGLPSAR